MERLCRKKANTPAHRQTFQQALTKMFKKIVIIKKNNYKAKTCS